MLPTCAQGLVEPSSRWLGEGENKWSSSWGLVLLLLILVSVLLVGTLINIRKGASSQWSASILLGGALHLSGSCPLGWETALGIVTTSPISQGKCLFYFPSVFFCGKIDVFSGVRFFGFLLLLGMLVAKWVPTPCYNDAYSVGTPKWASGGKDWLKHYKTMVSPLLGCFYLASKRTIYFVWWVLYGFFILAGPGILGLALGFLILATCLLNLLILVAG